MILQNIITYSKEYKLWDVLTQDISTTPPTFLSHYHFTTLKEVMEEIEHPESCFSPRVNIS